MVFLTIIILCLSSCTESTYENGSFSYSIQGITERSLTEEMLKFHISCRSDHYIDPETKLEYCYAK